MAGKSTRLHWRKHYCGDFLGKVALWPRAAVGTYAIMLDVMFVNGAMSDLELDAILASNSEGEAALIRSLLTRVEGGWIHHRVQEDREHSLAVSASKVRSTKKLRKRPQLRSKCDANATQMRRIPVDVDVVVSGSVSASEKPEKQEKLSWRDGVWYGITDADRAEWGNAYPAVNLERQFAAMTVWLKANPRKAKKSNWHQFVANWLSRQQDRGGDIPTNAPISRKIETTAEKSARISADSAAQVARIEAKRQAGGFAATLRPEGLGRVKTHPNNGTQQRAS